MYHHPIGIIIISVNSKLLHWSSFDSLTVTAWLTLCSWFLNQIEISCFLSVVCSTLFGIQDEKFDISAVCLYAFARAFGIIWTPTWFYLFPPNLYGIVFGLHTVLSIPFAMLNQETGKDHKRSLKLSQIFSGLKFYFSSITSRCLNFVRKMMSLKQWILFKQAWHWLFCSFT